MLRAPIRIPDVSSTPKELRMAAISQLAPGINTEDARLALELIIRRTIIRKTDPFRIKLDFITEFANAARVVSQGGYHFVTLAGLDYLSLIATVRLTPILILSKLDQPTEVLLLVSAKERQLKGHSAGPKAGC